MRSIQMLALLGLVGCGGVEREPVNAVGVGMAEVAIPLEIAEITDVVVAVSASDIQTPLVAHLAIISEMATGLIAGIPAGLDRTFSVHAYVGAVLVCTGTEVVEIVADTRVTVSVLLDCSVPPPAVGEAEVVAGFNFPPEILSVTATPSSVVVGGTVAVEVVGTDADGDALTYLWSATDGTFDDPSAAATNWTAPTVEGDYSVTIQVSDGTTTVAITIIITVTSSPA